MGWSWGCPGDGGSDIIDFQVQWRYQGNAWSGNIFTVTRGFYQITVANTSRGVDARVRARNSVGTATNWSPPGSVAASALLAVLVPTIIIQPPPPTRPDNLSSAPVGAARRPLIVDWSWGCPGDGGSDIIDFQIQWRYQGNAWSGNIFTVTRAFYRLTVANTTRGVDARVRARNSVGTAASWSPTGSVSASALLDSPPVTGHTFTASQTWTWPYPDITRAIVVLEGAEGGSGAGGGGGGGGDRFQGGKATEATVEATQAMEAGEGARVHPNPN